MSFENPKPKPGKKQRASGQKYWSKQDAVFSQLTKKGVKRVSLVSLSEIEFQPNILFWGIVLLTINAVGPKFSAKKTVISKCHARCGRQSPRQKVALMYLRSFLRSSRRKPTDDAQSCWLKALNDELRNLPKSSFVMYLGKHFVSFLFTQFKMSTIVYTHDDIMGSLLSLWKMSEKFMKHTE